MKSEEVLRIIDSGKENFEKLSSVATYLTEEIKKKKISLRKCVHFRHDKIPETVKIFLTVKSGQNFFEGAGYESAIENGFVEEADCWTKAGMENTAETLRLMGDVYAFFENRRLKKRLDDRQDDNYEVCLTDALASIALLMETEHEKVLLEYARKNANQFEF